jgi:zona occludens toxin
MITLITGTPGAGKTAWVVAELEKINGRRVYVDGIPDLTLPHEPAGDVLTWPDWVEDGALIVVDEVQRIWRPRGTGSKVPESIAALETHRHRGLDFWLISQHPNLLDANVRRLISRHVHLTVAWNGRAEWEWPECQGAPERRGTAVHRSYKLPAHVFDRYKSASLHTKITKRKPVAFYVGMVVVPLTVALIGYAYHRISGVASGIPGAAGAAGSAADAGTAAAAAAADPVDFQARVAARPETAPAYDSVRKVVAFPRIAACISSASSCNCYTQQATAYAVPPAVCEAFVRGDVFNPYASEVAAAPAEGPGRGTPERIDDGPEVRIIGSGESRAGSAQSAPVEPVARAPVVIRRPRA